MLSIKKRLEAKNRIKEYMKDVLPMEVYVGNYEFNKWDGCRYKVILGNAKFENCENLNLDNLQYISGILDVSDSYDLTFSLKSIGNGLLMSNNHNLSFNKLKEINGDCVISDTFIKDLSHLEKIDGAFCFNHSKIFKGNEFLDKKIKGEMLFER